MSITLDIRPYCHDCDKFEPEVWRNELTLSFEYPINETKVRCVNQRQCDQIEDYIREQILKEED